MLLMLAPLLLCSGHFQLPQLDDEPAQRILVGQATNLHLVDGEVKSVVLKVSAGDFVRGTVIASNRQGRMGLLHPDGSLLWKIKSKYSGRWEFSFMAEQTGDYELQFQGDFRAEEDLRIYISMAEPPALAPLGRVDQYMRAYPAEEPGIALVAVQNGLEIYTHASGLADLGQKTPMSLDTTFHLPYLSRALTTYAVLDLVERNQLSLDEEVASILPGFPKFDNPITIENLLRRESGLRSLEVLFYLVHGFEESPPSRKDLLEVLQRQTELNFVPGSKKDFDWVSDFILQEVIATLSGETFPEYMRHEVFRNLHMSSATFVTREEEPEEQTKHYALVQGAWVPTELSFAEPWVPNLSAQDFSIWAQFITQANDRGNTWWGRLEKFGVGGPRFHGEPHDIKFFSDERAWVLEIRALAEGDYLGAVDDIGRLLILEEAWPLEDHAAGGKYGGRGRRTRRNLSIEVLKRLEGVYESSETDLRFTIQLVEKELFVRFKGRKPIPTLLPSGTTKRLESALSTERHPTYSKMFRSLSFSEQVDGVFQVIRLSRSGVDNLLFLRVETN